jgi:hypothetical protein
MVIGFWAPRTEDRTKLTFNPGRYERILAQVNANEPIEMPWLYFERGRTRIMDGRHRLYVMIDLGYTHVSVVADPRDVSALSTLADDDQAGGAASSGGGDGPRCPSPD